MPTEDPASPGYWVPTPEEMGARPAPAAAPVATPPVVIDVEDDEDEDAPLDDD